MSKRISPKVSIICAAYNEEANFEEHLTSLVNQTYKNKEIIVVDDGSTDKTTEIGKMFSKRYKFLKFYFIDHKDGYGCVRPRLEAIKHATGSVLCIVDADGCYGKNNIEDGINKLFSSKKIAAVVPRMHAWDPDNFIAKYRAMVYESRFINPEFINKCASEGKYSPWLLKKKIYDSVGGYNIKDSYCEDLMLAKKILSAGYSIVHEPRCHWRHRIGEGIFQTAKKNFEIGRMHGTDIKLSNFAKVAYFTLPILLFFFGFFYYIGFILLFLHLLPMLLNGFRIFLKVRSVSGREYALCSPIVSYIVNIPYTVGFYSGCFWRYRK